MGRFQQVKMKGKIYRNEQAEAEIIILLVNGD